MQQYVIVNHPGDFPVHLPGVEVITARNYLSDPGFGRIKKARVFNLCRSYRYQKAGYYVSLLAAARNHKAIPDITTIQDVKTSSLVKLKTGELDELINKVMSGSNSGEKTIDFFFGRNPDHTYDELGKQVFQLFQAPMLRVTLTRNNEKWTLHNVHMLSAGELDDEQESWLPKLAGEYFETRRKKVPQPGSGLLMAILHDPEEKEPPSNPEALQRFIDTAASKGIKAQLITKNEYALLGEYDALFIRETTNVNHHTYRFARKAQMEGLVVVDDPDSIMKCSNKVYLAELLRFNGIPMPETLVISRENIDELPLHLDFPVILKQPDSAFSQGVSKVSTIEEYDKEVHKLLESSDMIVAQAFVPTPFDWRIGIFDGKPLFACKYFMASNHWQIYNWSKEDAEQSGDVETLRIEEVPHAVMAAALSSTRLIGRGLYGVDLKEINGYPYVIEVNDNPNIDAGIEDKVLGDKLYSKIIDVFTQRIYRLRNQGVPA